MLTPLIRYPAVSKKRLAFVCQDNIWIAAWPPRRGDRVSAKRLTEEVGEEAFPRFSPDGKRLAFTGNYDGNAEIYVRRLDPSSTKNQRRTHHPDPEKVVGWINNKTIVFSSGRESAFGVVRQLFKVPLGGGPPRRLPPPIASYGAFNPDGRIVFQESTRDFFGAWNRGRSVWKGNRGGAAPDLFLYDPRGKRPHIRNLTASSANDSWPMWADDGRLYFLSDRGEETRLNLWVYDQPLTELEQLTFYNKSDYELRFPSIGPDYIVFEQGGNLIAFDLKKAEARKIDIELNPADVKKPKAEVLKKLREQVERPEPSREGGSVVVGARGRIFLFDVKSERWCQLTSEQGVAERFPSVSPDWKWVAFFTDVSGEYELAIRPLRGGGADHMLTQESGPGFRYRPFWSPNGRKLAYIDEKRDLRVAFIDREKSSARLAMVDEEVPLRVPAQLQSFNVSWSPNNRWLAYSRQRESRLDNGHETIYLVDARSYRKRLSKRPITTPLQSAFQPVFDQSGRYVIFLVHGRIAAESLDLIDPASVSLGYVALQAKERALPDTAYGEKNRHFVRGDIDWKDIEDRWRRLPPGAGSLSDLSSVAGGVVYRRWIESGTSRHVLQFLSFSDGKQRDLPGDTKTVMVAMGGDHVVVENSTIMKRGEYSDHRHYLLSATTLASLGVDCADPLTRKVLTEQLETTVEVKEEWRQLFNDAWRFVRDYFYYYPDRLTEQRWDEVKSLYRALLRRAVTRWDLDDLIAQMVGEVGFDHTFSWLKDFEPSTAPVIHLLGIDLATCKGCLQIRHVLRGAHGILRRSPLALPTVESGTYIQKLNGTPLSRSRRRELWDEFKSQPKTIPKLVTLELGSKSSGGRTHSVEVQPITYREERALRLLDLHESNRRKVDRESKGQVGYVAFSYSTEEYQQLALRQLSAQRDRGGLIVDVRFNPGGNVYPIALLVALARRPWFQIGSRQVKAEPFPLALVPRRMVLLTNGWTGSNGELFAYLFRQMRLGIVMGSRTMGAMTFPNFVPALVTGGQAQAPNRPILDLEGRPVGQGGLLPDIAVTADLGALSRGIDRQLEAAIDELAVQLNVPAPERREEVRFWKG